MIIDVFIVKEIRSFRKKIKCNDSLKFFIIINKIVKIEN